MVNNHQSEAGSNLPLFFVPFVLILFFSIPASFKAQKIKKYYVSYAQERGKLFFIRPQKGFKHTGSSGHLTYDITCITSSDSLTLNFSYFDKTNRAIDSLALKLGSKRSASSLQKLFVEPQGSKWHYRYSARFSNKDLEAFFNQNEGAEMQIITKNGILILNCKKRKWKKNSEINRKIFQLIRYNS